jgi:hypothetical protein
MTSKKSSTRPGWGAQINDLSRLGKAPVSKTDHGSSIREVRENDAFSSPQSKRPTRAFAINSSICEETENDTFRFPQRSYRSQKVTGLFARLSRKLMALKKSSTRPVWGAQINDRYCKSLICEERENDTFRFPWSQKFRLNFWRGYQ